MGKDDTLAAWLDQAVDTPWAWGSHDCTIWPANWVRACGSPDPAEAWRGRYRTAIGAARLVNAAGGMAELFTAGAAAARLHRTQRIIAGDVGLIELPARAKGPMGVAVGAICIGGGEWAVVRSGGLWLGRARVTAAWRTPWRTR